MQSLFSKEKNHPAAGRRKPPVLWLGCALFLATLALYWPAVRSGFCLLDDSTYVTNNPHVTGGFSVAQIKWAFTSNYAANWHPLTWLSHMLDWTFYGDFAGGHHLTSILLHSLNTLLLFLALKDLTRALWPSLVVAAWFGWHPLHVESVAWIAERKDVLSTFFMLLALLAYSRYAQGAESKSPTFEGARAASPKSYCTALACFALGLLCKPMLVTLPFLLFLLDFWPLGRLADAKSSFPKLVREKIPFLVLSLAACVETLIAQRAGHAIRSTAEVPPLARLGNVLNAYSHYILKTFWPTDLSIYYLLPERPPVFRALIAAAFLVATVFLVWRGRRAYPWLLTGWFWFLGLLVPVIGFVQVGSQAMADRYTYMPAVGLFIMIAWSVDCAWTHGKINRPAVAIAATASLVACGALCRRQLSGWHDNVSLFGRAVQVAPDNYFAEFELGVALANQDDHAGAIEHQRRALRLNPNYEPAQYRLGLELAEAGQWTEAARYFSLALGRDPDSVELHNALGVVLAQQQKTLAAAAEFQQAIRLNPGYADSYLNLGNTLVQLHEPRAALTNYSLAIRLDPQSARARERLANLLATSEDPAIHNPIEAVRLAGQACRLTQDRVAQDLATLALAEAAAGDFSQAAARAEAALSLAKAQQLGELAQRLAQDLVAYRKGVPP